MKRCFLVVVALVMFFCLMQIGQAEDGNVTLEGFKKFWGDQLTQGDNINWISYSYGYSASGKYSLDVTESNGNIIMHIVMHRSEPYNSDLNNFINAYLNAAGYFPRITDWSNYTNKAISNSSSIVINGYMFSFSIKTINEYDVSFYKKGQTKMEKYTITAQKLTHPVYSFSNGTLTHIASSGTELVLPSYDGETPVENISISNRFLTYDENVTSIMIGDHVNSVDWQALNYTFPNLQTYKVSANNSYLASIDGCLYDKVNRELICCPPKIHELVIPEGIVAIRTSACEGSKTLQSVSIPSTCSRINEKAFSSCPLLSSVTFAANKKLTIGDSAFAGNLALEIVDLSQVICTEIGNCAFKQCATLSTINLPEGLIKIGDSSFSECVVLESISLPSSLQSIGNQAFIGTSISTVALPEGLLSIGAQAFDCPLSEANIPSAVMSFKHNTFRPSCLVKIADENTTYYEKDDVVYTFDGVMLFYPYEVLKNDSFIVPKNITSISCAISNIQEITIPASVVQIDAYIGGTWHVTSGSYAESYAIEKKIPYDSSFVEGDDLSWLLPSTDTEPILTDEQNQSKSSESKSTEHKKKLEDFVLADMSLNEMIALEELVLEAMKLTADWQEVIVPVGHYKVGTDIPAEHWQFQPLDGGYTYFRYGDKLDETGSRLRGGLVHDGLFSTNHNEYNSIKHASMFDIDFKEGCYFEVEYGAVVFSPYIGKNIHFVTDKPSVELEYQIDFGNASLNELHAFRVQLHHCMWATDEWKEVWLPAGLYCVGVDFPEGHWQIAPHEQGYTYIRYGSKLEKTGSWLQAPSLYDGLFDDNHKEYDASKHISLLDIDFKAGCYLEVDNAGVVITRYEGKDLGFKFK